MAPGCFSRQARELPRSCLTNGGPWCENLGTNGLSRPFHNDSKTDLSAMRCRMSYTSPTQSRASRNGSLLAPKARHNQQEKQRMNVLRQTFDKLQGAIWKENVKTRELRRPKGAILSRAKEYITILCDVLSGSATPEVSAAVIDFIDSDFEGKSGTTRAEFLRRLVAKHATDQAHRESTTSPAPSAASSSCFSLQR